MQVQKMGYATAVCLVLWCLVALVFILTAFQEWQAVKIQVIPSHAWVPGEPHVTIAKVYLALTLVTGTLFMIWQWRALDNVPTITSTWRSNAAHGRKAVLWWFCPFANFVMPFRVMRWLARETGVSGATGLINIWWAVALLSFATGIWSGMSSVSGTYYDLLALIEAARTFLILTMVDAAVKILLAVMAVYIVFQITTIQTSRLKVLEAPAQGHAAG